MEQEQKENKAKMWFVVYGILNIIAALFSLATVYITTSNTHLGELAVSFRYLHIFFVVVYLIAGLGLLRRKKWLPNLLLMIISISAYNKFESILSFGSMSFVDPRLIISSVLLSYIPFLVSIFFTWYVFKYKSLFSN